MVCAVTPGPVRSTESGSDRAVDSIDERFWAVLHAAGLIGRIGSSLEPPVEPAAEPAEVPHRPPPTVRTAVDRHRPRGRRPVPDPMPTPGGWVDPDGDGRLSRQRSPPPGAAAGRPPRGG